MTTGFAVRPIGVIRLPFRDQADTPIPSSRSEAKGKVEIHPEVQEGVEDLDGFSHSLLGYLFHCSVGYSLLVKTFLDDGQRGLFSTWHPSRPNPIGLSVVGLLKLRGDTRDVERIDVLDAPPLLDVKPYVPEFAVRPGARVGWLARRSRTEG